MYSSPKFRPDIEGGNTAKLCMQRSWSVEKFFDEEGLFAEESFMVAVRDFFTEYEQMLKADDSSAAKKTQ